MKARTQNRNKGLLVSVFCVTLGTGPLSVVIAYYAYDEKRLIWPESLVIGGFKHYETSMLARA